MTSITMNGGTALRAEGCNRRRAFSSINSLYIAKFGGRGVAPLLPYSTGFVALGCAAADAPARC
jgi:hypothetical protein